MAAEADRVVQQASSFGASDLRVRPWARSALGYVGFGCRRGAARAQWWSV